MPATVQRDEELEERLQFEIDPSLQKELMRHPGRWVAITRTDLIAEGETPEEALRKAAELGHDSPLLYRVPAPGEGVYFF